MALDAQTILDIFSVDGAGLQVENYIYMYHLGEFIVLPSFIDSVQENFGISWSSTTPLGRSAPIYSFQSAGPRTLQVTFNLHRDLMYQINKDVSDAKVALGDDYVDTLIKDLQACVLPDYDGSSKAVNPPIIALRVGSDIFIKGIITSNLGITWNYPILSNGKYSNISINLGISEIDPYDARMVRTVGSYRNVNTTLDYSNTTDIVDSPYMQNKKNQLLNDMLQYTSPQDQLSSDIYSANAEAAGRGTTPSGTGGGGYFGGGAGRRGGSSTVNQPTTKFNGDKVINSNNDNSSTTSTRKVVDDFLTTFSPGYAVGKKLFNNKDNTLDDAARFFSPGYAIGKKLFGKDKGE